MPTRLPSGNWRVQARRVIDGTAERRSFTAKTKKDALIAAAAWQDSGRSDPEGTVADAVRAYIEKRRTLRSPATIRGYVYTGGQIARDPIGAIPVAELTQKDVSAAVRRWSDGHAPKTVHNRYGLLVAALKDARPGLVLHTPMPEKRHVVYYTPSDENIRDLLEELSGTRLELPLILGAFAGMRRGEVTALLAEDISGGMIHIRRAYAISDTGKLQEKAPKTYAGTRSVPLPDAAKGMIPESGRVCPISPPALTTAWERIMDARAEKGLPVFRFHDLRHYCASRLHAAGIPDAYIMRWLGWSSDLVLKSIYRHALEDEEARQAAKIRVLFSEVAHGVAHEQ